MNNYSWFQQKLHKLALSSQFMRETSFELENVLFSNSNIENHVFVSGLARSGTTILLNAIFKSNEFASLTYQDMPFILSPNLWSKFSFSKERDIFIERAHNDGIKISKSSPEAFEEIFWKTFKQSDVDTIEKFKTYISLINYKYKKNRYLSKNNQNIKRIDFILNNFPNSKILIPFRDPIQHSYSLLNQHKRFIKLSIKDNFISQYMNLIGHSEFGPNYRPLFNKNIVYTDVFNINHWIEQWYLTYKMCLKNFKNYQNIYFVCFEKLCESEDYWLNIIKFLEVRKSYNYEFTFPKKKKYKKVNSNFWKKSLDLYNKLNLLY